MYFAEQAAAQDVITEPIRRFGLGWLSAAVYAPDGAHFATCGSQGAFVWDVETGEVVLELTGHPSDVNSVAFSPDGTRVLTGSSYYTARLWNARTGAVLRTFTGHTRVHHD